MFADVCACVGVRRSMCTSGQAGQAGAGWAGAGKARQGRAGQGRARQDKAGQGRAGQAGDEDIAHNFKTDYGYANSEAAMYVFGMLCTRAVDRQLPGGARSTFHCFFEIFFAGKLWYTFSKLTMGMQTSGQPRLLRCAQDRQLPGSARSTSHCFSFLKLSATRTPHPPAALRASLSLKRKRVLILTTGSRCQCLHTVVVSRGAGRRGRATVRPRRDRACDRTTATATGRATVRPRPRQGVRRRCVCPRCARRRYEIVGFAEPFAPP